MPNFSPEIQKSVGKVDLSLYNNLAFDTGAGRLKMILWYFCNLLFIKNPYNPLMGLKVVVLRIFGAKIGKGLIIKPSVNIKYPWKLKIGKHVWIGEEVWIDNLAEVEIQDHVCLSQGAMLLCGNHNYKRSTFDLITKGIVLESGSWVGAKAVVCPGVRLHSHAILSVHSVANQDLEAYTIYQGNPAQPIRKRCIEKGEV